MNTQDDHLFSPHELQELQSLFDGVLRERQLSRESEAAEWLAVKLFEWYRGGVRDATSLRELLKRADQ